MIRSNSNIHVILTSSSSRSLDLKFIYSWNYVGIWKQLQLPLLNLNFTSMLLERTESIVFEKQPESTSPHDAHTPVPLKRTVSTGTFKLEKQPESTAPNVHTPVPLKQTESIIFELEKMPESTALPYVHIPVPLKRTESIFFELEKQPETLAKTTVTALPYVDTPVPLKRTETIIFELTSMQTPSSTTNSDLASSSTWVSLPPPFCTLPKSLYGTVQHSSPLGPSPSKLYRRVYPYSSRKPNLYRQVLIARMKKAVESMPTDVGDGRDK